MPVFQLDDNLVFPPVELAEPDGLLAVGGDLSVERLVLAYSSGIFPWYSQGSPILWWSTDPRCVLFPQSLHIPKSMHKVMKRNCFRFTVNTCFYDVITACSTSFRAGQNGTWIVPDMVRAYCRLHEAGIAHSIEVWQGHTLVGGLYGIALGRAFFGESMFYDVPNASKAAIIWLIQRLAELEFQIVDCQQETEHMLRFGAECIARNKFISILSKAIRMSPIKNLGASMAEREV